MVSIAVSVLFTSFYLGVIALPSQNDPTRPTYLNKLLNVHKGKDVPTLGDVRSEDDLRKAIERMASAFEAGDASAVEDCLVRSPILFSLKAKGDEKGFFGPSQIKFMFEKLFEKRETRGFTYDSERLYLARGASVSFRADWTYVVRDEDELATERLRFKMERSGNDWRVSEIRSAPH